MNNKEKELSPEMKKNKATVLWALVLAGVFIAIALVFQNNELPTPLRWILCLMPMFAYAVFYWWHWGGILKNEDELQRRILLEAFGWGFVLANIVSLGYGGLVMAKLAPNLNWFFVFSVLQVGYGFGYWRSMKRYGIAIEEEKNEESPSSTAR